MSPIDRAQREREAYDEQRVWERCHQTHMRFRHVFECPNTRRADRLYDDLLRRAVPGKRVLELGCAEGTRSRTVASFGAAYVLGGDISEKFLAMARPHAIPGRLEFANLDFARRIDGQFDVIFGSSVLHHLDYRPVMSQLYEDNLLPGGTHDFSRAAGLESDDSRVVVARALCPHPARTTAVPLRPPVASEALPDAAPSRRQLPLPAGRDRVSLLPCSSADNRPLRWCDRADHWLDTHCAWLVPRFRHSVIVIEKPQAASERPLRVQ